MKFYIFVLISVIATCISAGPPQLTQDQHERLGAAGKACIEQVGVTPEAVQQLHNGNFADADEKSQCFVNCILEKLQALKNGQPQEEVIVQQLSAVVGPEQTKVVMQDCNGIRGANNCETGFKIYQCYHKHDAAALA